MMELSTYRLSINDSKDQISPNSYRQSVHCPAQMVYLTCPFKDSPINGEFGCFKSKMTNLRSVRFIIQKL